MKRLRISTRDWIGIVIVVALALTLVIDRRRHRVEMGRREQEARDVIYGLSHEVYRSLGRPGPAWNFVPKTPLPPRYDWNQQGVIVPEWAEQRRPGPTPRPSPVAPPPVGPGR